MSLARFVSIATVRKHLEALKYILEKQHPEVRDFKLEILRLSQMYPVILQTAYILEGKYSKYNRKIKYGHVELLSFRAF